MHIDMFATMCPSIHCDITAVPGGSDYTNAQRRGQDTRCGRRNHTRPHCHCVTPCISVQVRGFDYTRVQSRSVYASAYFTYLVNGIYISENTVYLRGQF